MSDLVRVCQEWFPETNGFAMDFKLKEQIDTCIINVVNDWDFVFIITGGGEVRVGKSVLGLQIMTYWNYAMWKTHKIEPPFEVKKNIVFNWDKLIQAGNDLAKEGKYFSLQYDEAGETMEGSKSATMELKAIKDYLRECGQYNSLTVLVMPEYFTLPIGIALTRSICLIDVYYGVDEKTRKFTRGYFRFYSRAAKKKLYLNGKKELNYKAAPYSFDGEFRNFYPIDEAEYREAKKKALQSRVPTNKNRLQVLHDTFIAILHDELKLTYKQISEKTHSRCGIVLPISTLTSAYERAKLYESSRKEGIRDDRNDGEGD